MTGYSYGSLNCRKKLYLILLARRLKLRLMKEVFIGHKNLNETFKSYAKYLPKSLSLRAKLLDELRL